MAAGCTLLDGTKKLKDYFALEKNEVFGRSEIESFVIERIEMPLYLPLERRRRRI